MSALSEMNRVEVRRARFLMNCIFEAVCEGGERQRVTQAVEQAFAEIRTLENRLSRFLPASEISRVNQSAFRRPVRLEDDLFGLLDRCVEFSRQTEAAFDVTMAPLLNLWRRAAGHQSIPTEQEIDQARQCTGTHLLQLNPRTREIRFARPGMALDLGAVGKGYALDRAAAVLEAAGVNRGYITAGSTVRCLSGTQAAFGVCDPEDASLVLGRINLVGNAASTSSQGERFFEVNGQRFGHILDPRTGRPVRGGGCRSATVLAHSALESDMASTAVFVAGSPEGANLAGKTERMGKAFVVHLGL